jgi:gamma-glutamyltranspeptidase/glutathione hydrolase
VLRTELIVAKTEAVAENGMVAGGHPLEADVGVRIMQEGGNAIDAMAAAAFMAWVVEPAMCGIGGVGLVSVYLAATKEVVVVDHLHRAPLEATADMYELETGLDDWERWRRVKDNANMVGYLSIAIPGSLAGICAALEPDPGH